MQRVGASHMRIRNAFLTALLPAVTAAAILALAPVGSAWPAVSLAFTGGGEGVRILRGGEGRERGGPVRWLELDDALGRARDRKKLVLVDVYTDWCVWCKRMERDTYTDGEVRDYLAGNFFTARLNAEDSQRRMHYQGEEISYREFANDLQVNTYPTTLFLTP